MAILACRNDNVSSGARSYSIFLVVGAAIGVFMPSSYHGEIGLYFPMITILLGVFFCGAYSLKSGLIANNLMLLLGYFALLFFYTIISPFKTLTLGAIFPYVALIVVMCIRVNDAMSHLAFKLFNVISLLLVIMGFGVVLHIAFIRDFIQSYYQMFNSDLFVNMVVWYDKPVGPFATHSLAAFAYAILIIVYFKLSLNMFSNKIFYKLMCIAFLLMLYCLKSFSSVALLSMLGTGYLYYLFSSKKLFTLFFLGVGTLIVLLYVDLTPVHDVIAKVFSSESNGLKGRYTGSGRLDGTYQFVLANPFGGVGLTSSPELAFGDSFIAEYVLRTSFLGYLLVVMAAFFYFRFNFHNKKAVFVSMVFLFLGDLGYPLLTNYRFIFLIPVLVLVWNYSERHKF